MTTDTLTQQQILEGNEIIARFMEMPLLNTIGTNLYANENLLCYHIDWNLLIPVYAKIDDIATTKYFNIVDKDVEMLTLKSYVYDSVRIADINEAFKDCVNFINWYNNNK